MQFITYLEKAVFNFIWKNKQQKQKNQIAKTILYNKRTSGGIAFLVCKLYYRATVIKSAWYWYRNRQGDQWN